jgi:alkyl sulfatase BDS1-like metallo-beta-lactamase superfamily hydrolase
VAALSTDEGLVLFDTGSRSVIRTMHTSLRRWSSAPVHTIVYTHGHVDHVMGTPRLDEEAADKGHARPRVIAQDQLPARFDRYVRMNGYYTVIARRQFFETRLRERAFGSGDGWPKAYRYPDVIYDDALTIEVGGDTIELHHGKGETDDHTWAWIPGRKLLCVGDMFIWVFPNAGNPQKVQRYPLEWAQGLRAMAALDAEVMLPGHGPPIMGADRIRQAFADTAELLESVHDQTLALMNQGCGLNDILHTVRIPGHLTAKPYLHVYYDDPEFMIHNVWRLYGGWFDGNPATLKPARDEDVAREVAALAGGTQRLAARATELARDGDLRLAGHVAEMAFLAGPSDAEARRARMVVNQRRAAAEPSLMAKGIFATAAMHARDPNWRPPRRMVLKRKLRAVARVLRSR